MRHWNAPTKADIIVSELLGSFGDNELSPECLDGAQRFLKPNGISIPRYVNLCPCFKYPDVVAHSSVCMYACIKDNSCSLLSTCSMMVCLIPINRSSTSYLAPISSAKLWKLVDAYAQSKYFETPFVVKMHNFFEFASPQSCFTFRHPSCSVDKGNASIDNSRYIQMEFETNIDATLHGFSGYFHCNLYKNVNISIYPPTRSEGMFSWFPIYFPLKTPMLVPRGKLIVAFWRVCGNDRVWYEWAVLSPVPSAIHNANGSCYHIKL
jgi:protein arginine N-methyltransferase 5